MKSGMKRFAHRTCSTELVRYVGDEPLVADTEMRSKEWRWGNGLPVLENEERVANCPDCGKRVGVVPWLLKELR